MPQPAPAAPRKRRTRRAAAPAQAPVPADAAAAAAPAPARTPNFGPIQQKRMFEQVCDQIRREVAAGTLQPGDRLPAERDLAEQFGVSRAAVREALRSLEMAGFVHCQQGVSGGSFIRQSDSGVVTQAVRDMVLLGQIPTRSITEARILVTEVAIRVACERATEADFEAIERDIDRSEQLTREGNFSRRTTYITEFYRVLARATHNEIIVMLVESLSEIVRSYLAQVDPVPRVNVVDVRRRILKHMRARDAAQAVAEMTRHLRSLSEYIEDQQQHRAPAGQA
ncbi:FadR/GntR family transcriptional regulator [Pigmentiphaga soli]|uniref:FadR/GntR family transcriptional regulator n=1 Tax=Pigmentiphaga soli TaxID=1007095 RepID=A0ABP8H1Y8_9BURK